MDPQYAYQSAPANFMPMMAGGGLADAAQQVQSQGRGDDTMLVHMTPGEVKGLQALAMAQGGSLTTNPNTGLPEAGVLRALLPMIAGFALGPAGFGLMSATGAGLTVGALTGIATGSLKKGLMAGLGAYGGAGLGQGLVSAATPATDVATQVPNLTSAGEMAVSNVTPEAAQALSYGDKVGLGMQSPYFQAAQSNIDPSLLQGMTAEQVVNAPVLSATPGVMPPPTPTPSGLGAIKSGFENVLKTGPEGTAARAAFSKALPFGTLPAAAAPIASAAMEPPKGPTPSESFIRPYTFAWNPQAGAYTPSPTPGDTAERRYFDPMFTPQTIYRAAQGGEVNPFDEMTEDGGYEAGGDVGLKALAKKRKSVMGDKLYKFSQDRRDQSMEAAMEQNFAKGGLGAALPPRFLSGGGDGMSDSIKANIDGKQEARLADGEFVVPADVVSHLGNGSSKAGAKKLYAMMDKIRKARTGSKRQAPEVNAAKYMPA
jgi:hypothetical protein